MVKVAQKIRHEYSESVTELVKNVQWALHKMNVK